MTDNHLHSAREQLGKGATAGAIVAWVTLQPVIQFVSPALEATIGFSLALGVFNVWAFQARSTLIGGALLLVLGWVGCMYALADANDRANEARRRCAHLEAILWAGSANAAADAKDRFQALGCKAQI